MTEQTPNRLISEKSPYLLQHANNPVDWYPWGDEAFEKAEREDKPVFLSVGYSTCHWCHVMEKESFEDPEVAEAMNRNFVSVKVDREERPDLDNIYMTVCQMMTGSGGWPLTVVMTPDKRPFFATTYVPKETRFGRVGMMELIPKIQTVWQTKRETIMDSAEKVVNALEISEVRSAGNDPDQSLLDQAYQELAARFDKKQGGFGSAPKFPTPHNLLFVLRYWKRTRDPMALNMVERTLRGMRLGGIYDQLGYGFHRYSTDDRWLVPHFEKMLYDQALLAIVYLETYQATGRPFYAETAHEIFGYVLRDMTAPEGGFYSAEDADSEGEEGKFYLWTEGQIRAVLDDEAEPFIQVMNVEGDGNFLEETTGRKTGQNILHPGSPLDEWAERLNLSREELEQRLEGARARLFAAREKRVRPHRDDKILADWNGLMIAALARGAQVLGEQRYAEAAQGAIRFVLDRLKTPDGRLLHRYREGDAGITAHLDDYAFMIWGLIEQYQATFEPRHLKTALELNQDMINHYWDDQNGGFFFVPDDGEALIVRKKEIYDGAIPSGNSVGMYNLFRLARLSGRAELDEKGALVGRAFSEQVRQIPSGYTQFMNAVDFGVGPSYEVVIVGKEGSEDTRRMIDALRTRFVPNHVLLFKPSEGDPAEIEGVAPFVVDHHSIDGSATAYVCLAHACQAPTTDPEQMLDTLD